MRPINNGKKEVEWVIICFLHETKRNTCRFENVQPPSYNPDLSLCDTKILKIYTFRSLKRFF